MPPYSACLVDVFDTVLSLDFERYTTALAEHAGVDAGVFTGAVTLWSDAVMDGSTSLEEAFEETLRACSGPLSAERLAGLVAHDRDLVQELSVVHEDAVPFLETLRARGVRTALVSNCSANTRPLLDAVGLSGAVDEVVLSCEVGAAKPGAAIFETAIARLDVGPEAALFVDDQQRFCDGAAAVGIRAVRISRRGGGDISSLSQLVAHF